MKLGALLGLAVFGLAAMGCGTSASNGGWVTNGGWDAASRAKPAPQQVQEPAVAEQKEAPPKAGLALDSSDPWKSSGPSSSKAKSQPETDKKDGF